MDRDRVKELFHEIGLAVRSILKRAAGFVRRHWRAAIAAAAVAAVVIAVIEVGGRRRYTDYTVRESVELEDTAGMKYALFRDNILRYNTDGAFYTDTDGHLLWSESYEMSDPQVFQCDPYLIIYDKSGTDIHLLTADGLINRITTSLPIVDAQVAGQGTVAVLMQENETGYIRLYNLDGNTLASGEVHLKNTGYPLAMAFSEDAQNLVLSLADLNDGDVKTTLNFYNFGSTGASMENNIIATYSYANTVMPRLRYVGDGRLVAFGDNEIVVFDNHSRPGVQKEIHLTDEIRSIFYNDNYFGYITDVSEGQDASTRQVRVYNSYGRECMQTDIDMSYSRLELMDNNELLLVNDADVAIYNLRGVEKYRDTLESNVYEVVPQEGSREYVFIREGYMEQVRLR